MKQHRNQLILAAAIVLVLSMSFFWGSSGGNLETATLSDASPAQSGVSPSPGQTMEEPSDTPASPSSSIAPASDAPSPATGTPAASGTSVSPSAAPTPSADAPAPSPQESATPEPAATPEPSSASEQREPEGETPTCTLIVRCDTLIGNDRLDGAKQALVPANGILFSSSSVVFYEGESVFNMFQRELRRNGIHMEFVSTPMYDSIYIEGIGNLYEFDCGDLSGWMYQVNGVFPGYGCSNYILKDGDVIQWLYTCDLGRDIGGGNAAGKQR